MDSPLGPLSRREFTEGHCGERGPRGRTGDTRTSFDKEGEVLTMSGERGDTEKGGLRDMNAAVG